METYNFIIFLAAFGACASNVQGQVEGLQQSQKQLSNQAAINLAHIGSLNKKNYRI